MVHEEVLPLLYAKRPFRMVFDWKLDSNMSRLPLSAERRSKVHEAEIKTYTRTHFKDAEVLHGLFSHLRDLPNLARFHIRPVKRKSACNNIPLDEGIFFGTFARSRH